MQAAVVRRVETFSKILTEARVGERVSLVLDGVTSNNLATGYVIRGSAPSTAPVTAPPAVTPRGPDPRFGHAESEYARLRKEFDAGRVTSEAFEAALTKLMFESGGRYWMIGANTGQWYASQGDQWIATTPPKQ